MLFTQVFLIHQDISRKLSVRKHFQGTRISVNIPFSRPRTQTFWHVFNRSQKRGRRPQARGLRGPIEIAKCAIFRSNCATLNVPISGGEPHEFVRSIVWNFRRWAIVFQLYLGALWASLNLPFASYLNRQCMHSVRMSQYYINITRNTRLSQKCREANKEKPALRKIQYD